MKKLTLILALLIVAAMPLVAGWSLVYTSDCDCYCYCYCYCYYWCDCPAFYEMWSAYYYVDFSLWPPCLRRWVQIHYSPHGWYRYYYYDYPCYGCTRVYIDGLWRYRRSVRLDHRYTYREMIPDRRRDGAYRERGNAPSSTYRSKTTYSHSYYRQKADETSRGGREHSYYTTSKPTETSKRTYREKDNNSQSSKSYRTDSPKSYRSKNSTGKSSSNGSSSRSGTYRRRK